MANEILVKLSADVGNFKKAMRDAEGETQDLTDAISGLTKASAGAFVGLTAGIGLAVKSFAKFETGLVGVAKTANLSEKQADKLGKRFQKLSTEIPVATSELLEIGQAAGQLGVTGSDNILKFSETIAKLGRASDLQGEAAATTLTRILNVTGDGVENIDRFASSIVALGNNFAASEAEIARVTNEVARATAQFKIGSANAAGISTALKSLGVQAELAGTVVGKSFRVMETAIAGGGAKLDQLSRITGLTGAEIKKVFQEDSTKAFDLFVSGLGRLQKEGAILSTELAKVGLTGEGVAKVLPAIAGRADILTSAIKTSNKAYKENTALTEEFARTQKTLDSQFTVLQNSVTKFSQRLGTAFLPTVKDGISTLKSFADSLNNLDSETIANIASFLKIATVIAGVVTAIGSAALAALTAAKAFAGVAAGMAVFKGAAIALGAALSGPVGVVLAAVAAVTALGVALNALIGEAEKDVAPKSITAINGELDTLKKKLMEVEEANKNSSGLSSVSDLAQEGRLRERIKLLEEEKVAIHEVFKAKGEITSEPTAFILKPVNEKGEPFNLGQELDAITGGTSGEVIELPLRSTGKEEVIAEAAQAAKEAEAAAAVERQAAAQAQVAQDAANKAAEVAATKAASQRKLDIVKEEIALTGLQRSGASEQELEAKKSLISKMQAIDAANLIKDDELRALELEKINEQYLVKEESQLAHFTKLNEQEEMDRLEREEAKAALREAGVAQDVFEKDEDLLRLGQNIKSQKQMEQDLAKDKIAQRQAAQKKILADEKQYGVAFAKINQVFRSEEIQGANAAANELVKLQGSKSKKQQEIGKASARVLAAVDTARGAIAAYASLAGIPIVGPVLGGLAAAAVVAFGVETQGKISAANQGGFIPGGGPDKDSQLSFLTPGEFVVPRSNANEVINAAADKRNTDNGEGDGGSNGGIMEVMIGFKGDAGDMFEEIILERRAIGTGIL